MPSRNPGSGRKINDRRRQLTEQAEALAYEIADSIGRTTPAARSLVEQHATGNHRPFADQ